METQLSISELILNASLLVQIVMVLLLLASVISWTVIFKKIRLLGRVEKASKTFEKNFWSGTDMTSLFDAIDRDTSRCGSARVFRTGYNEFRRLNIDGYDDSSDAMESLRRLMLVEQTREIDLLEAELPILATVGSTSPYVGLFGTVWGIMNSFIALGGVQQATLAMVAPGIAEALIATAMGLFAAIPAVVAYNSFSNRVIRLETRMDTFVDECVHMLQRQMQRVGA